ncbi:exo-alpha-sialidase [Candidatus Uhrbacteria bacterium]|nr:exo-alpha-sialidase [Candidatus Uhrbacteria bacterium]
MKKLFIVGAVVLVILVLAGIGLYIRAWGRFFFSRDWKYQGYVLATGECNMGNPEVVELADGSLMMYAHGQTKDSLVLENNTYGFSSQDGKNWKDEGLLLANASMPTAVRLADGRIRMYFIRTLGEYGNRTKEKGIMSAVSSDGRKFEEESGYRFEMGAGAPRPDEMEKLREYYTVPDEGRVEDIKDFAHLNVAQVDGGYRIYFDESGMRADPGKYGSNAWPLSRERSIFSEDGVNNWRLDPGVRIDVGQPPLDEMQRASNPSVLKLSDGYHMFFFAGFSPWEDLTPWKRLVWGGTYEAISQDGLNFQIINFPRFPGNDASIIRYGDKLLAYPGRAQKNRNECSDVVMFEKQLSKAEL